MPKRRYEYALQVEKNSGSPMSRDMDGTHFADKWSEVMAHTFELKKWYKRLGYTIKRIDYKDAESEKPNAVQSMEM